MRLNVCRKAGYAGSDSSSGVFRKGWHMAPESALPGWTPEALLGYQERASKAVHAVAESKEEIGQSGESSASVGSYGADRHV